MEESHLERIQRIRGEQWNIIITAILFGLTLNLISDFISSSYDISVDPTTWATRGGVAGLASLSTVLIMWRLAVRTLRPSCKIEREIQISYFFDRDTGLPHRVVGYPPSEKFLFEFTRSTEKQRDEFTQTIRKASESPTSATSELLDLVPFLELLTISEITHRREPFDGEYEPKPLKDKIRMKKSPIGQHIQPYAFKAPGAYVLDYSQQEKGGRIDLQWKNGCSGRVSISFEFTVGFVHKQRENLKLEPITGEKLHLFELISRIHLQTNFSPTRLLFKISNVEKLINWSKQLINRLVSTADWDTFTRPYKEAKENSESSGVLYQA